MRVFLLTFTLLLWGMPSQADPDRILASLQRCAAAFGNQRLPSSPEETFADHFNISICDHSGCWDSSSSEAFAQRQLNELHQALEFIAADEQLLRRLKGASRSLNIQIRFLDSRPFRLSPYPLYQPNGTSTIVFYVPLADTGNVIQASRIYDLLAANRHRPFITRIILNRAAARTDQIMASALQQRLALLRSLSLKELVHRFQPQIQTALTQFASWLETTEGARSPQAREIRRALDNAQFTHKLTQAISQHVTIDATPIQSARFRVHFALFGAVVRNHHRIVVTFSSSRTQDMNSDSLIRLQDVSAPVLDLAFGVLGASVDTVDDITVNVEFNVQDLYLTALELLQRED